MKPPVQWNCECCEKSGLLTPPVEPIMVQDGEIEVPEKDSSGKIVYETIEEKDEKGKPFKVKKPKMKKVPKMKPKMGKRKQQNPVTSKMEILDVPTFKDLAVRIRLIQLRVGDEVITRYLCTGCLNKQMPTIKPLWNVMEGMNL